ncbi:hypothetical protein N599_02070 [Saccharopolyspora erythraea D]|nr:hypothetical protein N599_02070 [Saccharopolyspora erythraea D]
MDTSSAVRLAARSTAHPSPCQRTPSPVASGSASAPGAPAFTRSILARSVATRAVTTRSASRDEWLHSVQVSAKDSPPARRSRR